MKALAVLAIVVVLAISPLFFEDAFAGHIARDSGGFYTDLWYIVEVDNTNGECLTDPDYQDSGQSGGLLIESTDASTTNFCIMMKSFDTADLEAGFDFNGGCSRTSGQQAYYQFYILDGEYDPSDVLDFPVNSPMLAKGGGILVDYLVNVCINLSEQFPDLSSSTEGMVTIVIELEDDDTVDGKASIIMNSFELIGIPEPNMWQFCTKVASLCGDTLRTVSPPFGSGELEWYEVYSYNPEFTWVRDADVVDLSVMIISDTEVKFDWSEIDDAGIGIQNVGEGLNVTGYHLEIKNGTAGESDYWTMANSAVGDVETINLSTLLEAGHDYTARLLTVGANDWLSEPSNEVTFTMTGTSGSTQLFDEAFFVNDDTGVDNRVYYRENAGLSIVNVANPRLFGLCSVSDWYSTASAGYQAGTTDVPTGECYTSMLILPTAEVDGVEWVWTGLLHRSIAQVYHHFYIFDGALDVYNSTQFPHSKRTAQCQQGDQIEGCVLYKNTVPTLGTEVWTPDLSASNSDYVTFVAVMYDAEITHDVWTAFTSLSIAGYQTFYSPNTVALQAEFDERSYVDGTEHDWGYFYTLFPPVKVTIDVSESGDDALLTWNNPDVPNIYTPEATGFKIEKECPAGNGWQVLVADTGLVYSFLDLLFLDSVNVDFYDTFDVNDWTHLDEQNPDFITVDTTLGHLHFDVEANGFDTRSTKPIGFTLSDTEWTMLFNLNWNELSQGTATNHFFFGVTDDEFQNIGSDSVDFMGFYITINGNDHRLNILTKNGAIFNIDDSGYDFPDTDEDGFNPYVVKMIRNSAVSFTMELYSMTYDPANLINSVTQNDVSSVTALDHFVASNWDTTIADESEMGGFIDRLIITDGGGIDYIQEPNNTTCNYRVTAINSLGSSQLSNEQTLSQSGVSLTSPDSLVCGANGQNAMNLSWAYSGAETPTGFRIDGETPKGGGFTQFVPNTLSTSIAHTVTGLLQGTEYNFKVAVVVGADTSGFSNEYSCITQSSGGGGGGESPSEPIVIVDPETGEDTVDGSEFETLEPSDPISESQSEIFDLSFPLIQELTNTFTGDVFTLIGGTHFAGLGQTVTGNLLVGWDNTDNLIVSTMIIADSQMDIHPIPLPPYFAEGGQVLSENELQKLSITLPDLPNIKSHQLLPYEIVIPNAFCGTGFSPCIEAGTHKIPIKVVTTQGGENVANSARIEITVGVPQIQLDIPTFVMFALVAIGLVGAFMVSRRFKKKKSVHV